MFREKIYCLSTKLLIRAQRKVQGRQPLVPRRGRRLRKISYASSGRMGGIIKEDEFVTIFIPGTKST
jgi:hypothetical protein